MAWTTMTAEILNEMRIDVHIANAKWWEDLETGKPLDRNMGELCMLVVSELAEAMEGHRKNLMDDKLLHRKMFEVELADAMIRLLDIAGGFGWQLIWPDGNPFRVDYNVGDELFDICNLVEKVYEKHAKLDPRLAGIKTSVAIRRIYDLASVEKLDIMAAFHEKMLYNALREDHKKEHRMGAHGKKY